MFLTANDSVGQFNQDFLSEDVMAKIELALNCVLINVFALLGLIGTSINLLVLCQYNITTDTSNILLVSLSVADLLFCLTVPISRAKCLLTHFIDMPTALRYSAFSLDYFMQIPRLLYFCSMSMVGVISTERFLAVFFPFKTSRLMTPFRMKLLSVLVYVVNALMFSPTYFILTHDYVYSEKYQGLVPVIEPTEFFQKNFDAINIEIGIVYNIAVSGTSFLVTLVFTPAIAIKLWLVSRERTKLTNRKGVSENHVAKLLLTVCAMSIVFYGPFIGFNAAITFLPQYSSLTNVFQVFLNVADFSGTVCAFSNFLIYVTMSRKFRNKYKELVLKCCISRNNNSNENSRVTFGLKRKDLKSVFEIQYWWSRNVTKLAKTYKFRQ